MNELIMEIVGKALIAVGAIALLVYFLKNRKEKPVERTPSGEPFTPITVKGNVDLGTTDTHGPGPTDADKAAKGKK